MDEARPGYYAVIPADVRYDDRIPANAKLLYGEISALSNADGVCTAGNEYFSSLYGLTDRTIRGLVNALEEAGYVKTAVVRDEDNGQVSGRVICLTSSLAAEYLSDIQWKKTSEGGKVFPVASGKKLPLYIKKNNIYIPPKPPQGGDAGEKKKRSRGYKAQAETLPERFEKFWEFYRAHVPPERNAGNRQQAIRAWDKLAPNDELATTMAIALAKQVKSQSWATGVGIPHASTWLNNHGWEDDWGPVADLTQGRPTVAANGEAAEWVT